jgi:hypothetical protein
MPEKLNGAVMARIPLDTYPYEKTNLFPQDEKAPQSGTNAGGVCPAFEFGEHHCIRGADPSGVQHQDLLFQYLKLTGRDLKGVESVCGNM